MIAMPKVLVATPRLPGQGCEEHDRALDALQTSQYFEVLRQMTHNRDVVRARDQTINMVARKRHDATHLLFVDHDVEINNECIGGMFRADRDIIAAPYPDKRIYKFSESEHEMYRYSIRPFPEAEEFDNHQCMKVAGIGMGCMLVKLSALRRMIEHYATTKTVSDRDLGTMVSLCDMRWVPTDNKTEDGHPIYDRFSEDMSFCLSARDMGLDVWMYLGRGSPVTHHGHHAFRGSKVTFGLQEDV